MPLIIFMLVPIIEMWILIEVGGWIGALPTIGLVVLTATLGLSLLKHQGLSTLMSARRKMDEGSIPASELVSGVMIGVGGALLLTPGFVTDAFFRCPGIDLVMQGNDAQIINRQFGCFGQQILAFGFIDHCQRFFHHSIHFRIGIASPIGSAESAGFVIGVEQ